MAYLFGEIEGTGFEILSSEFANCLTGHGRVERLWTGARWLEGPVWFPAGKYLLISDIPNNRILRWDETDGSVSVFRKPSYCSNGNTIDHQGRLITCEHKSRRVTRTEHNGSITIVADSFNNKKLNSPNDVAFNHDETSLFISDTGLSHMKNGPKHIRKIKVNSDGSSLGESKVFAECNAGLFDGFRFDTEDRLWTSAADGVHCFSKDGKLIGKIRIPEMVANVCFGGSSLNRLFIAGTTSIYSAYLAVNGRSCIV